MSISHLFNAVMDVYTVTNGQSSTGGIVEAEVIKHSALLCLIEKISGGERALLGREGVVVDQYIYCDVAAIVEKDSIQSGGKVYDVVRVDDVQAKGHHMELLCMTRE